MQRRNLLKGSAVAAIGAVVGFLFPGLSGTLIRDSSAAPSSPRPAATLVNEPMPREPKPIVHQREGADLGYAGGTVVSVTPDGVLLKSLDTMRAVRIQSDSVVWKEFETSPNVIELGDWIDVKGTPLDDGTLLAESGSIFVNIGRRDGIVESVSNDHMTIRHSKGVETVELSTKLEVVEADTQAAVVGGVAALSPGTSVGLVGLRLPGGGFRATRIWR